MNARDTKILRLTVNSLNNINILMENADPQVVQKARKWNQDLEVYLVQWRDAKDADDIKHVSRMLDSLEYTSEAAYNYYVKGEGEISQLPMGAVTDDTFKIYVDSREDLANTKKDSLPTSPVNPTVFQEIRLG